MVEPLALRATCLLTRAAPCPHSPHLSARRTRQAVEAPAQALSDFVLCRRRLRLIGGAFFYSGGSGSFPLTGLCSPRQPWADRSGEP